MLGPGRHNLVQIGPEDQSLLAARSLLVDSDRDEWRIFDNDAAPLGRGYQPKAAVALAAQHGGKQLDQRQPVDRRTAIEPGAVAGDPHIEVAELDRRRSAGAFCGGL